MIGLLLKFNKRFEYNIVFKNYTNVFHRLMDEHRFCSGFIFTQIYILKTILNMF